MTIHLIYPHGPGISSPSTIGRHLVQHLSQRFAVIPHEWDTAERIVPQPGDILIGHPHPEPRTIFRRSLRGPWHLVVMLCPFNTDQRQVAFLDPFVRRADWYLAITGGYWMKQVVNSPMAHWVPKLRRLDLAVDPSDFPPVKKEFNEAGRRRFVYIGQSGWPKGTDYLSQIARRVNGDFGWYGRGPSIDGISYLGYRDFSTPEAQAEVSAFDFLVTASSADANPATILEAMAWGVVPVCTRQSGYDEEPGIVNIPAGDATQAALVLEELQTKPAQELKKLQQRNWERVVSHYNWDRFCREVEEVLTEPRPRAVGTTQQSRARASLALAALTSPYSWLRPPRLRSTLRRAVERR